MTHRSPETLLDLALGLLPPTEAEAAQAHVQSCAECAQAFQVLEDEQRVLREVVSREPAAPALLERGILERVRAQIRRPGAPRRLVAAAALAAVGLGLFLLRPDDPQKVTMLQQLRTSERMALGLGAKQ